MAWRKGKLLEESKERIERIDRDRRVIDKKHGMVTAKLGDIKIGEARELELAVLHVGIDDFKELTRDLTAPQLSQFLSLYLTEMMHIIKEYNGATAKYVDDKVTALLGVGVNGARACQDAIDSALSMLTDIKYSINPYFSKIGLPVFSCAVGIDFGVVWIERIGSEGENQFCQVGSTVNIAAQLEKLAGKNKILIGHDVFRNLNEEEKERCRLQQIGNSWRWKYGEEYYPYYAYVGIWNGYPLT